MKKQVANQFKRWRGEVKKPLYVVAHARWQQSRGRAPSMSYRGERNPRVALAMALEDLKVYEPGGGEHVSGTAARLAIITGLTGQDCQAQFNDVTIIAHPGDSVETLSEFYSAESRRRHEEWERSEKGQEYRRKQEETRARLQKVIDDAMLVLPTIDFTDFSAVIDWLSSIRDASDHVGVVRPHELILQTFHERGFEPNVFCNDAFVKGDKEIEARWLIGQALSCLQGSVHAIHQMFDHFADLWREQFTPPTPAVPDLENLPAVANG